MHISRNKCQTERNNTSDPGQQIYSVVCILILINLNHQKLINTLVNGCSKHKDLAPLFNLDPVEICKQMLSFAGIFYRS